MPKSGEHEDSASGSVNVLGTHSPTECEDRDNSHSLKGENEPGSEPGPGTVENRPATDDRENGLPLELDKILERYCQNPIVRMRSEATREAYVKQFRRLAEYIRIEQYTRRQLAGPKGKHLLLDHIATNIPLRSRRPVLSALAGVWKVGLNLPWPIDLRNDIGKLPRTRRRETPQESVVKVWYQRLKDESRPYVKVLWLLIAQFGLRPGHVVKLRWSHLRYDEQGLPCEIRANGADEGFKTFADLDCHIPPDLARALVQLRKWLKDSSESDPILPKMAHGRVKHQQLSSGKLLWGHWNQIRARYDLPKLRMADLRHWVASRCRDEGLSEQARAYMQGHEQPIRNMGDVYDNRSVETNLARQAQKFPHGVLGTFEKVDLEVMPDIPKDLLDLLVGYHDGKVGVLDLIARLDAWKSVPGVGVSQNEP